MQVDGSSLTICSAVPNPLAANNCTECEMKLNWRFQFRICQGEVRKTPRKTAVDVLGRVSNQAPPVYVRIFAASTNLLRQFHTEATKKWKIVVMRAKFSPSTPWRRIQGAEVQLRSFLASARDGTVDAPAPLLPGKNSGTHRKGGWERGPSQSGGFVEDRILLSLPRFEHPNY